MLASECSRWQDPVESGAAERSTDGTALSIARTSHCLAGDKAEKWVKLRKAGKHDWLKDSPLYNHLGAHCYGASADYFVTLLEAFEGFNVSSTSLYLVPHLETSGSQVTEIFLATCLVSRLRELLTR